MTAEHQALLKLLEQETWRGLFSPHQAVCPADAAVLKRLFKSFVKSHAEHPAVLPFRKPGKARPGPVDDRLLAPVLAEWLSGLPACLERLSADGACLTLDLAGTKKRLFALRPEAARSLALEQQVRCIGTHVAALRAETDRLERLSAQLGQAGRTAAGSPGTPAPELAPAEELVAVMRRAWERLDTARLGYVPIHELRTALAWSRAQFDAILAGLARERRVELQVGNPSEYDNDELMNSFVEEDGTLYLTVSFRGER